MLLMSATVSAQFGGFFKDAKKYARQRERDETITVEHRADALYFLLYSRL